MNLRAYKFINAPPAHMIVRANEPGRSDLTSGFFIHREAKQVKQIRGVAKK